MLENKYRTMQEIVYDTIKDKILNGQYPPGQRLITSDLAAELGVSRMPVREALQRLEAATGLVSLIPHKGVVVNTTSEADLSEIFIIRSVLEGLAARLACEKIKDQDIDRLVKINCTILEMAHKDDEEVFQNLNKEFHSVIWDVAKSPRLVSMLQSLHNASRSYRYISIKLPGRFEAIVQEHEDIIAAFRKGDALNAERIVANHYQQTLEWLLRAR